MLSGPKQSLNRSPNTIVHDDDEDAQSLSPRPRAEAVARVTLRGESTAERARETNWHRMYTHLSFCRHQLEMLLETFSCLRRV
jgi:hypothetical protein